MIDTDSLRASQDQPHADRASIGAATRAHALAEDLARAITHRRLAPGARLPSVREHARRNQVSPGTVVAAYDRLQAQGLIIARPQRGFFVRDAGTPPSVNPAPGLPRRLPTDAMALIRGMFATGHRLPAPAMGTLPEDWLDSTLLQRALRRVCAGPTAQNWLRYGEPAGSPALRLALARRLADMGIATTPDHVITAVGASQALDIVARTLLTPGDAVIVDEPGWSVEYARLRQLGMRLLAVPRGIDGPDLERLEALVREHRPRLYATVSVLHNPTGASLSPSAAHQVLRLAEAHGLWVVEDDSYGWLAPPHATRLSQLDALRRTILVSGFSKVLAPQWRVGFIAAPPALTDRFIDTKMLSTLTSASPLEDALAWCLDQGLVRRHADRLIQRLDAARSRVIGLVRKTGAHFVTPPAGMFGWVDVGTDTDRLAPPLLDAGWLTAPGGLFYPEPRRSTLMRVNFATSQDLRFWQAVKAARGQ